MRKKPRGALPRLIGVLHLTPLPGAPCGAGADPSCLLAEAGERAVKEAVMLERAGFDGLIIENFADTPFFKCTVPPETVASMSIIAAAVRESVKIPVGINILRNDGPSALAVAAVTGCSFIRVNVLCGVVATDQGLVDGDAAMLMRKRMELSAENISVLADVHVKHARQLSSDDIALAVEETALRAMADAVIVTGSTTGRAVDLGQLKLARDVAKKHSIKLYAGSGCTAANISKIKPLVYGVIVGSAIRKGGMAGAPLDHAALRAFARAFKR